MNKLKTYYFLLMLLEKKVFLYKISVTKKKDLIPQGMQMMRNTEKQTEMSEIILYRLVF